MDLSLPVMEEKPQRPNQMMGGRKKDSTSSEHQEESLIEHTDRPSKHVERKLKKQAKKEAKVILYSRCTGILNAFQIKAGTSCTILSMVFVI